MLGKKEIPPFTMEGWQMEEVLDRIEALKFNPRSWGEIVDIDSIKTPVPVYDIFSHLRESVWLNTDSGIHFLLPKPYEYADMSLVKVDPSIIIPTAKYVLRKNLTMIEALDKELGAKGIDIFGLTGIVQANDDYFIAPPVFEVWNEAPYNGIPVIVDGAHRLYYAMKKGIKVNCVIIYGNISSDLPVLPLGGWQEVFERDTVPKDKRNYRLGIPINWKPHELYRQTIPGSRGPRVVNES